MRTITLVLVALFSIVIVLGVLSPSGRLAFILVPLLLTILLLYSASMSRVVLRGKRVGALSDSINLLAPCLCVGLIVLWAPTPSEMETMPMAIPILLLGLVGASGLFSRSASRKSWIVLRSLAIALVGAVVFLSFHVLSIDQLDIPIAILIGVAVPVVASMMGLLRDHSNQSIRRTGRMMDRDRNSYIICAVGVCLMVYISTVRSMLITDAPDLLSLVDWIVMATVLSLILLGVFLWFRSTGQPRTSGSWWSGSTSTPVKGDMEVAGRAIDRFVNDGRKEELLVVLTSTMLANGVAESSASKALMGLVDYGEEEVGLAYRWTYGDLMRARRQDRREVVEDVVQRVADAIGDEG